MRPLTKDTVKMVRQGLLESDWCGFSKRDTVNQLCDLALKGLMRPEAPKSEPAGMALVPRNMLIEWHDTMERYTTSDHDGESYNNHDAIEAAAQMANAIDASRPQHEMPK